MDLALSQCLSYFSPADPKVFENGVRVEAAICHPAVKIGFVRLKDGTCGQPKKIR